MKRKNVERVFKLTEVYESYSIEDLERKAYNAMRTEDEDELEAALSVRQWKLNEVFEWTPENKEKLLHLNTKLIECFEKLKAEATIHLKTLEHRRKDANDAFLQDFEIEAKVMPYIFAKDEVLGNTYEFDSPIAEVLNADWNDYVNLQFSISNMDDLNRILYLNREQNWNIDHWFKGQFDEHFISQAIHDLYDHTNWSFQDILKINYLWANVTVDYQHFEEI
ncbi:hypothetical protein FACS1894162_7070 [Bacteroidia bacterium]|nr:hypothetical protein FACS1894162_7070 [Bacteroidia bacterium]